MAVSLRFWFLIAACTLLGLGAGVFFALHSQVKFEAQTLVMAEKPVSIGYLNSRAEILRSRNLAKDVIKEMGATQKREFWRGMEKTGHSHEAERKAMNYILDNLEVRVIPTSQVIDIRFRHIDPIIAAYISNRLVHLYLEQRLREKTEEAGAADAGLESDIKDFEENLHESIAAVETYRKQNALVDGAEAEDTSQQISEMNLRLDAARAVLDSATAKSRHVEEMGQGAFDQAQGDEKFGLIKLLQRNENELQVQYDMLNSKFGSGHPRVLVLEAEIRELKDRISGMISGLKVEVDAEVDAAKIKMEAIEADLKALEDKKEKENKAAITLRELQRKAAFNRILYEKSLKAYERAKLPGQDSQQELKIISMARPPGIEIKPFMPLTAGLFAAAGFFTGILLSLFFRPKDVKHNKL